MSARRTGFGILLAGMLGGTPRAAAEPELPARVDALLGAYRAVTAAEWRALGPAIGSELERVARDRVALPTRRARALAALGAVRPTSAGPLIRELAADGTAPEVLRCAAVDAASSVLGPEASEVLVPLLRDRAAAVRLASARVLAGSGAPGCRAVAVQARTLPSSDPVARTAATCQAQLRIGAPAER
jgi:HEAT repeat protein